MLIASMRSIRSGGLAFSGSGVQQRRDSQKYEHAGCKEYWIIDPKNERITVYIFDDDNITYLYTFDDKIPVGISNGECEVDFSKIKDALNWGAEPQVE